MLAYITLTVTEGGLRGREYVLPCPGSYTVGRSDDCAICLSGRTLQSVSRRHCLLRVEPAAVNVYDLGSCNGTYVNGEMIGCRSTSDPACESAVDGNSRGPELNDGDLLRLGNLVMRVGITQSTVVHEQEFAYSPGDFI